MAYVLITVQHGAIGAPEVNAYGPGPDVHSLEQAGHLLADGASPEMTVLVVPLQPPKWDSV